MTWTQDTVFYVRTGHDDTCSKQQALPPRAGFGGFLVVASAGGSQAVGGGVAWRLVCCGGYALIDGHKETTRGTASYSMVRKRIPYYDPSRRSTPTYVPVN
jgi:hypothetical protein